MVGVGVPNAPSIEPSPAVGVVVGIVPGGGTVVVGAVVGMVAGIVLFATWSRDLTVLSVVVVFFFSSFCLLFSSFFHNFPHLFGSLDGTGMIQVSDQLRPNLYTQMPVNGTCQ